MDTAKQEAPAQATEAPLTNTELKTVKALVEQPDRAAAAKELGITAEALRTRLSRSPGIMKAVNEHVAKSIGQAPKPAPEKAKTLSVEEWVVQLLRHGMTITKNGYATKYEPKPHMPLYEVRTALGYRLEDHSKAAQMLPNDFKGMTFPGATVFQHRSTFHVCLDEGAAELKAEWAKEDAREAERKRLDEEADRVRKEALKKEIEDARQTQRDDLSEAVDEWARGIIRSDGVLGGWVLEEVLLGAFRAGDPFWRRLSYDINPDARRDIMGGWARDPKPFAIEELKSLLFDKNAYSRVSSSDGSRFVCANHRIEEWRAAHGIFVEEPLGWMPLAPEFVGRIRTEWIATKDHAQHVLGDVLTLFGQGNTRPSINQIHALNKQKKATPNDALKAVRLFVSVGLAKLEIPASRRLGDFIVEARPDLDELCAKSDALLPQKPGRNGEAQVDPALATWMPLAKTRVAKTRSTWRRSDEPVRAAALERVLEIAVEGRESFKAEDVSASIEVAHGLLEELVAMGVVRQLKTKGTQQVADLASHIYVTRPNLLDLCDGVPTKTAASKAKSAPSGDLAAMEKRLVAQMRRVEAAGLMWHSGNPLHIIAGEAMQHALEVAAVALEDANACASTSCRKADCEHPLAVVRAALASARGEDAE